MPVDVSRLLAAEASALDISSEGWRSKASGVDCPAGPEDRHEEEKVSDRVCEELTGLGARKTEHHKTLFA